MLNMDYLGATCKFPRIASSKNEARLFKNEDEAFNFWQLKGRKYQWFLKKWIPCKIRCWKKGRKIMIGDEESEYLTAKTRP